MSQGNVSGTKTYPTCPKCSKNHCSSSLQERNDDLDAVALFTNLGIVLLNRVNEVVMIELPLQLQNHKQVRRLSRVTHMVRVAVSAITGCMLIRIDRIWKVLLM